MCRTTCLRQPNVKQKACDAHVEEFDLELAIGDATGLSDELVEAGLRDRAVAVSVHIDSVRIAGRLAVDPHAEPTWRAGGCRAEDQVRVPSVEAVPDRRVRFM